MSSAFFAKMIFLALQRIRGRSAEDPQRTPAEDRIEELMQWRIHLFIWWSSEELVHYQLHPLFRQTIRGGSAEGSARGMNG